MERNYDLITVGLIVRNQADTLPDTLHYLLAQSYPLKDYGEIVIADGDSTDNTRTIAQDILSSTGIRYTIINERDIHNPYGVGYGHSRGRNVVLMHANPASSYIARIDGDCRADPERLMNLWKTIAHNPDPTLAGAGGTRFVETQSSKGTLSMHELVLNYYFTSRIITLGNPAFTASPHITYIPSVAGYNSIFRSSIFTQYRYDTTFPFNTDDVELNYRLRQAGYRFLYAPDAKIFHRGEETMRGFFQQMYKYGQGVAYTMRIHRTPFVRLYAWIGLSYVIYTLLIIPLFLMSQYILGSGLYLFIPYLILLVLGLMVWRENYTHTHSIQSILVIPTLYGHLRWYGWGVIVGLLAKKPL